MHLMYTTHFIYLSISFFFNDTATTEIYTLSLHDALPIYHRRPSLRAASAAGRWRLTEATARAAPLWHQRSEEHTSELQSHVNLVCRLLLEKKKTSECTSLVLHSEHSRSQTTAACAFFIIN